MAASRVGGMDFRYLGNSGLKVSEISYGNWLTHGSQVENEQAKACVKAALEAGITTFDTADIYANTKAETVLGEALEGVRRESLEILTKVYWPTGPGGPNDVGLVPQAHPRVDQRVAEAAQDRLRGRVPGAPVRHRDAARGDDGGVRRRRPGRARRSTSGPRSGPPSSCRRATGWPASCAIPLVSNQPQYSMLWRVIEAEVVPASEELGIGQVVFSPIAQGVLTGKYKPGQRRRRARGRPTRRAARTWSSASSPTTC